MMSCLAGRLPLLKRIHRANVQQLRQLIQRGEHLRRELRVGQVVGSEAVAVVAVHPGGEVAIKCLVEQYTASQRSALGFRQHHPQGPRELRLYPENDPLRLGHRWTS